MSAPMVTAIANAIAEGSKLWHTWLISRDKRRMQAAIEYGEKYIQVSQKSGQFETISDDEQVRLLRKYSKYFFKVNN